MRVTMTPMVRHHMLVSSGRTHADLHRSMQAERCGSGAAGSGSAADAVSRRLQPFVSWCHPCSYDSDSTIWSFAESLLSFL